MMGSQSVLSLVYFSCVSKAAMILAKHTEGDAKLEELAVQCLERVPPLHNRLTHTTRRKMYSFLMDGPFVYCAIVDEVLEKSQAFVFLEHVRDEFKKLLKKRGCERDEMPEKWTLDNASFGYAYSHSPPPLSLFRSSLYCSRVPIPVSELSSYLRIMKTRAMNDKESSSNPQPSTVGMQAMLVPHGMALGAWESCRDLVLCTPGLGLMKRGSSV